MSDFQKSFSESKSSIKFDEKYIDNSVQPNDIGVAEQWAVKTVSDPCVGNLATPVNSGYFTKAFINNLPFYREGISPNFRGLETGAAFGYLLYGPLHYDWSTKKFRICDHSWTSRCYWSCSYFDSTFCSI